MKRVIITGGSTGLGQELSKQFLQQGREVVCLSRTKPPLDVAHLETDFTDKGSIAQSVATLKKQYADFSVVICCAGIGYIEKLEEMNYEHTQAMFDVNLIGQSYLLSGLAEEIRHNVADLVFIGATIGFKWNEYMPMYSVSKRGLRGLVENWRMTLKGNKNRILEVSPWGMDTESNIWPEGREMKIASDTGRQVGTMLSASKIAEFVYSLTQLPSNMEISSVIINRK